MELQNIFRILILAFCILLTEGRIPMSYVAYLRESLLNDYNKDLRPHKNYDVTTNIHLRWYPLALYNFDEVNGILSVVSSFGVWWIDDNLIWKGSPNSLLIEKDTIWHPELALNNAAYDNAITDHVAVKKRLRVLRSGQVRMLFMSKMLHTLCSPDMVHYPVDVHTCFQQIIIKDYTFFQVAFGTGTMAFMDSFQNSSKWDVINWNISFGIFYDRNGLTMSNVNLTLTFKRKPSFILYNMVSPIILLSVINVFVFFLPVVSGERISYAMTIFLSLAVYMTLIAEKLPDGNPVSLFTYFIVAKLMYSALIILGTIIGLQFHHGDRSVLVRMLLKCSSSIKRNSSRICRRNRVSNIFKKFKNEKVFENNDFDTQSVQHRKEMTMEYQNAAFTNSKANGEGVINTPNTDDSIIVMDDVDVSSISYDVNKVRNRSGMSIASAWDDTGQTTLVDGKTDWTEVAKIFDRFCLVFFLMIIGAEIITWVVITWFA